MADVFSQLYIQLVFAVKNRQAIIDPAWEVHLYRYTTTVIQNRGHKLLAIGGMPDHIHLFIGHNPAEALSALVRETKKITNIFIKDKGFCRHKFDWQSGYGAFSYSLQSCHHYVVLQAGHAKRRRRDTIIVYNRVTTTWFYRPGTQNAVGVTRL